MRFSYTRINDQRVSVSNFPGHRFPITKIRGWRTSVSGSTPIPRVTEGQEKSLILVLATCSHTFLFNFLFLKKPFFYLLQFNLSSTPVLSLSFFIHTQRYPFYTNTCLRQKSSLLKFSRTAFSSLLDTESNRVYVYWHMVNCY